MLHVKPEELQINDDFLPDFNSYDHIIVAFSGGKDSLACVLHLLKSGVDPRKIELHHHDVDGGGNIFMDWAVTPDYCRKVAAALGGGLPLYFSYKVGGFEREMNRNETVTAPIRFEEPDGNGGIKITEVGGQRGKKGVRMKFPQLAADLKTRWCSAYLKIDVMSAAICNQPRFRKKRLLVVTGERADESTARAKYKTFEPHRTDRRKGTTARSRLADHWRPIHAWSDAQVWDIIKEFGVVPHVAYQLGWSRLSCLACIFGSPNQWATILHIFKNRFLQIEAYEEKFGVTIRRSGTIRAAAEKGTVYKAALNNPNLVELAKSEEWYAPIIVSPADWVLPAGATGEKVGPT
jgi:3'-phosphoadenosine 5'-phosphosulfate sulfotransferase (PAPS reductase)/FAD synthetase